MSSALERHVTPRRTPQSEPAREDQVKNNAGGFVFVIDDYARLNRFLTLGVEGGTYYVTERDLTRDNAGVVTKLAKASDPRLVNDAVAISQAGRAPCNDPALFALAAASGLGSTEARAHALWALPQVARTGGHILKYALYAEMFRGWGPQLIKGVRNWYTGQSTEGAAYQVLKYKQRDKWAQRDLIRLAHVQHHGNTRQQALWNYIAKGVLGDELAGIPVVQAAAAAHATQDVSEWVSIIEGCRSLSHEMLPSEATGNADVWRALIANGNVPLGALTRNLAKLTRLGVLAPMDSLTSDVATRIADSAGLAKARIHPVEMLLTLKAYAAGRPMRGRGGTWTPVPVITDACDAGFYAAYGSVEPSGKRIVNATDTSGSMGWAIAGYPFTAVEAVAAMAMVTQKTEPYSGMFTFSTELLPIDLSPRMRLDAVIAKIMSVWGGSTDCAAPMTWATRHRVQADVFRVWTDGETWYGPIHPHQALEEYRQKMGIDARLQVIAISPTEFSIARPEDGRELDVSGFDSAIPTLLADHARGDI